MFTTHRHTHTHRDRDTLIHNTLQFGRPARLTESIILSAQPQKLKVNLWQSDNLQRTKQHLAQWYHTQHNPIIHTHTHTQRVERVFSWQPVSIRLPAPSCVWGGGNLVPHLQVHACANLIV